MCIFVSFPKSQTTPLTQMRFKIFLYGFRYDLMKYCWMWSFKDRPAFSSIMKLLESSLHLAATKDICVPEVMDIFEYNRKAGLLSQMKVQPSL